MAHRTKIKVLVVDSSPVFRAILERGLSSDPQLEVVATAGDPFEARDRIIEFMPDIMTCDIEMPRMNGIEFIRRLLPQYTLPVVVVSSVKDSILEAISAGAVDFIGKPATWSPESVVSFIKNVILKVKTAGQAKNVQRFDQKNSFDKMTNNPLASTGTKRIIAIGASTGGVEAIFQILQRLAANAPGIVIVQHIPADFSDMFAERLNKFTPLEVREARTGDLVERGRVLVAPGDQHLCVKKYGESFKVECLKGEKVNGHRPSIDVLFSSVASAAGENGIGIILTGMGCDGAIGLLEMRKRGARTIGQDEATSIVYGMPKAAWDLGAVENRVSLADIPEAISTILTEGLSL